MTYAVRKIRLMRWKVRRGLLQRVGSEKASTTRLLLMRKSQHQWRDWGRRNSSNLYHLPLCLMWQTSKNQERTHFSLSGRTPTFYPGSGFDPSIWPLGFSVFSSVKWSNTVLYKKQKISLTSLLVLKLMCLWKSLPYLGVLGSTGIFNSFDPESF